MEKCFSAEPVHINWNTIGEWVAQCELGGGGVCFETPAVVVACRFAFNKVYLFICLCFYCLVIFFIRQNSVIYFIILLVLFSSYISGILSPDINTGRHTGGQLQGSLYCS
jgi:hypothetical protein